MRILSQHVCRSEAKCASLLALHGFTAEQVRQNVGAHDYRVPQPVAHWFGKLRAEFGDKVSLGFCTVVAPFAKIAAQGLICCGNVFVLFPCACRNCGAAFQKRDSQHLLRLRDNSPGSRQVSGNAEGRTRGLERLRCDRPSRRSLAASRG